VSIPHFLVVWFSSPYVYVAMPFWAWSVVVFFVSVGLGTFFYFALNGRVAMVLNRRSFSVCDRLRARRVS